MRAPVVSGALPLARLSPGLRLGGISSACSASIGRTVRQRTQRRHPYLLALLGMLPAIAGAACDWSKPGSAPYRGPGDVTAATAVESYRDIPADVRADLAERIRGQREDALALITRDGITSPQGTASALRDMHWKGGMCVGPVVRTAWAADRVEAALVYCSAGHCVVVPTVCGNVARVDFTFKEGQRPQQGGGYQPVHQVPEPSTVVLVALGVAAMWRRAC